MSTENKNNPPNGEQNNDANILKQEEEFARMVNFAKFNYTKKNYINSYQL